MTVPADAFEPDPWGLHNVHGNVWEWCQDLWQDTLKGHPDRRLAANRRSLCSCTSRRLMD